MSLINLLIGISTHIEETRGDSRSVLRVYGILSFKSKDTKNLKPRNKESFSPFVNLRGIEVPIL